MKRLAEVPPAVDLAVDQKDVPERRRQGLRSPSRRPGYRRACCSGAAAGRRRMTAAPRGGRTRASREPSGAWTSVVQRPAQSPVGGDGAGREANLREHEQDAAVPAEPRRPRPGGPRAGTGRGTSADAARRAARACRPADPDCRRAGTCRACVARLAAPCARRARSASPLAAARSAMLPKPAAFAAAPHLGVAVRLGMRRAAGAADRAGGERGGAAPGGGGGGAPPRRPGGAGGPRGGRRGGGGGHARHPIGSARRCARGAHDVAEGRRPPLASAAPAAPARPVRLRVPAAERLDDDRDDHDRAADERRACWGARRARATPRPGREPPRAA